MGTLTLIRHGQASFGADDYDQLSPLGERQAFRLGQYLQARYTRQGIAPEAVLMGSLKRHQQTWDGIARGAGWSQQPVVWPELNEYDSHALISAIHPEPLGKADTPELYRAHFRLLREALQAWMDGRTSPAGMPSYAQFVAGLDAVLDHVRSQHSGQVLVVSSGGPISTIVGRVLQAPPHSTIELNLRIRNTALTELAFTPKRHVLVSHNNLPHLDGADHEDWVTHA